LVEGDGGDWAGLVVGVEQDHVAVAGQVKPGMASLAVQHHLHQSQQAALPRAHRRPRMPRPHPGIHLPVGPPEPLAHNARDHLPLVIDDEDRLTNLELLGAEEQGRGGKGG
jgi:hypothetical protein